MRSFDLIDPATTKVEIPLRRRPSLPAYFRDASADGAPDAGDDHVERAGLDQGDDGRLRHPPRARRPRHLHPDGRLPRAAARRCGCTGSPRRSTPRSGRPPASTGSRPAPTYAATGSDWSAGRSAATTPPGPRRSRSASRCASPGAPTTTGARCRSAGCDREGENPVPHYWDHVLWVWGEPDIDTLHRVRRGRPPRRRRRADHRAVPRSRTGRTTGRSRSSTPTAPTTRPSTARSASCGSSPRRRAPPSTSASTTSRTSSSYIADWVADTFAELDEHRGEAGRARPHRSRGRHRRDRRSGSRTGADGAPTTSAAP